MDKAKLSELLKKNPELLERRRSQAQRMVCGDIQLLMEVQFQYRLRGKDVSIEALKTSAQALINTIDKIK